MPELIDARTRLTRAKATLAAWNAEAQAWFDDHPDAFGSDTELVDGREVIVRARVSATPPREWALYVSDFLVDLRAALDYSVYSLAAMVENPSPGEKQLEFPIGLTAEWFDKASRKKLAGLTPAAIAVIEEVQPYNHGDETNALHVLNELVNVNKHRFLIPVWAALDRTVTKFSNAELVDNIDAYFLPGLLEDGTPLLLIRLRGGLNETELNTLTVEIQVVPKIAFAHDSPAAGFDPFDLLATLGGVVEAVIDRLEDA